MSLSIAIKDLVILLKEHNLWVDSEPTLEQLSSIEPFAVDKMPFEQWLQWIFIPKIQELIDTNNLMCFSHKSDIHTMAEYVFKDYKQDISKVLMQIKKIDLLLNSL